MISLQWIKEKVFSQEYYLSGHADTERKYENISLREIEESLSNCSILEVYQDTGRGNSCLVVGFTNEMKPVHCVCGVRGDRLVVITVYIPKMPKFISPFERSKNE